MKPTLVILAAGMGSRYGGLKQMDAFGPSGEAIIDYSIYDAIQAGFGKVVFIIRHDFAEAFKKAFDPKLQGKIEIEYVYQELTSLPEGFNVPEGREKPWGTAHASMMAHSAVNEPFLIINADDFYGKEAYKVAYNFLTSSTDSKENAVIGYRLNKTITEHGTVSRGVCVADKNGNLTEVVERLKIKRDEDGKIYYFDQEPKAELAENTPVSMNMWAFKPNVFDIFEEQFIDFLKERGTEMKSEYLIPTVVMDAIQSGDIKVKLLDSPATWFGVTYPEDKPFVIEQIKNLLDNNEYPQNLWK
ncbi:MAG: NDP-sugar synthase [Bacteroidales bacterium]